MAIDWSATGEMLSGIGTLAGAAAVALAAVLGRNALKDFRSQRQIERELEHAEKILTAAYALYSALDAIRGPMSTAYELDESRKELESKELLSSLPKERADRFVQANVFYIRARYFEDEFSAAEKLLPFAAAFFGDEVKGALHKLIHNRHVVRVYADAYARDFGHDKDFDQKIRAAIWKGFGAASAADEVTESSDAAVAALEAHLFPIIRHQRSGRDSTE